MSDLAEHIHRLETYLSKANDKLVHLEKLASMAKGPVSKSFAERMADAARERDHLKQQITELKLEDALSWSSDRRSGVLQVCDEIGHRLDELFSHLDQHEH